MSKCILTIEDDFKDGQPIIRGKFDVVDVPVSHDGGPVEITPAQLYIETIKRLWDAGSINTFVRMAVPDLLYKNNMLQQQKQVAAKAAAEAALAAAVPLPAPANDASPIDRNGAVDAEVLPPPAPLSEPIVVEGVGKAKGSAVKALVALAGAAAAPEPPTAVPAAETAICSDQPGPGA